MPASRNKDNTCPNCRRKFKTAASASVHEKLSTRCTYSGNFMKRWYGSMPVPVALLRLKRRHRSIGSDRILKIPAETKTRTSGVTVASTGDEELECVPLSLQAQGNTCVDNAIFPTGDGPRQTFFVEEDNTLMERDGGGITFMATVGNNVFTENFPEAAMIVGKGHNLYSRNMITDEHREKRKIAGPFYPFSGKEDWDTFKWLSSLQVPMEKLDEFFELPYVKYRPLSFSSTREMKARAALLPATVPWKQVEIKVQGAATKEPMMLYYRDALECFKYLFSNPLFSGHMDFVPRREYTDEKKRERLYNEMMTGDRAWDLQNSLEVGKTVGLVILASDKVHLTVAQGSKECHAVYLSCGNIKKALRTKISAHTWMLIAQIPIAKFEPSKHQTLFTIRAFHQCLNIIVDNLKKCAINAVDMTDPNGCIRSVHTFLAAYIADLPEQQFLAGVRQGYAPSSYAEPSSLGSSRPHKLRRGEETLSTIKQIQDELSECNAQDDLALFEKLAKSHGLNGVVKPFWRGWYLSDDPSIWLVPDILHQLIKFFQDHVIEWARKWLTDEEFDKRLSVLQPRPGFRHFKDGYTKFKQHTGKETKDVLRVFLALIVPTTSGITKAVRALIDFIYLAQYDSHSTVTLQYLQNSLNKFHKHKKYIAESGVRDGPRRKGEFHIPKLELMQHYKRQIELNGSAPQFSSDQPEKLHNVYVTTYYRATNHKNYAEQMCLGLYRAETIYFASDAFEWASHLDWATNDDWDPVEIEKSFQEYIVGRSLATPTRNVFQARNSLCNETTAFQLRQKSNAKELSLQDVQWRHDVPNFISDLCQYFLGSTGRVQQEADLPFNSLNTWWRVRVQLKNPQDPDTLLPPQVIQASPPLEVGDTVYHGRYNFVLLRRGSADDLNDSDVYYGIQGETPCKDLSRFTGKSADFADALCNLGCRIAQLRVIFVPNNSRMVMPIYAYVQLFRIASNARGKVDPDTQFYRFVRDLRSNRTRKGLVIPLTDIWRPVELIPKFNDKCNRDWTCDNAVECSKEFYLNCFADKPTFIEVY